jgi:hypothetical protein
MWRPHRLGVSSAVARGSLTSSIELEEGSKIKQPLAIVCSIALLSIVGCARPTQPRQPAAKQAPSATEEEPITTMDFESGEAETPTEASGETEADSDGVGE